MIFPDNTSEIVDFTRLYLALFYSFVALFYTVRIITVKKNTNQELVFTGERFCSTWWNHFIFGIFRASIWMVCVFRFYFPSIDDYLGMISSLENIPIIITGNVLITFGFLLTVIIHFSMGCKWRSGIDPKGPEQLITDGFYQFSRNPIFLCIALSQMGFFLALPSVFSLTCLIIGLYTLYRQTLSEERHLLEVFPSKYRIYLTKVRRWI
ncbi:isoprenylcysteine carboxylmethyltransferase family protein [Colwelliaceae bacterium BS250]